MNRSKASTVEGGADECGQDGFLCKKCSSKYDFPNMNQSISMSKSKNFDLEEEKEEEIDCYYCLKSNQMCNQAALLYKGKACCLQSAPDGKQRTIITRRQESVSQFNSSPQQVQTQSQVGVHIQQHPSSTKNAATPGLQQGFFPSKFGSHQKHQSDMLHNKNENNGNNPNSDNPTYPQIHHEESQSQNQVNFNPEQNNDKTTEDNIHKHQKNSQTDPFVGRNIQNINLVTSGNLNDMTQSCNLQRDFNPGPQVLLKDQKIEVILQDILKRGQSYIQKKAIFSLVENRKTFSSQRFHDKLDKKKQILYVIILKSGFIFGGYHYIQLKTIKEKEKKEVDDQHCGIFSMQGHDLNFYPVENNKIVYYENGVWFGKPPSLVINFDMIDKCFCNKDFIFLTPQGETQTVTFGPTTKWNQIIQDICILQF